uniref:G-protein coupled receptors family 1 profile domain-containing protein n=1 Tax=Dermatophagoides pteronyssinus TaxID=6956 RepID=A0A6P6XUN6_DERPT|nr:putative uncharacterized protein DDB_G0267716 [Dermatophagoides pteronyssinus]
MLAVVVAVFATLWLPYRALVVYNSFSFPPYMELWYLMFAKTMIFVNSAINPIIYSACSMKFRREFKRMLTCGRKKRQSTNMANYRYTAGITTTRHGIAMKSVAHDFGGGGGRGDNGINESSSMTFTMGPNELSEFPATNNNKFRRTSPPSSDNLDFQTNRSNQFKQQQQQHSSTISVTICNELKSKQDETTAATSINNQSIKNQHNDNDDVPTILIGYDNHQQQQSTSIFDDNDDDNDQSTKTLRSIISRSIANGSQTMNNNNNNNNMMDDLQTIKTTTITSIAAVYSDHNHDGQFFRTETISNNNNNNDNDHQLECPEHQF